MDDLFSAELAAANRGPQTYDAARVVRNVTNLRPSERWIFEAIVARHDDRLVRRLAGGGHALVLVGLPDASWVRRVLRPLDIALSDLAGRKIGAVVAEPERSGKGIGSTDFATTVLGLLAHDDVAVPTDPGQAVDPSVAAFADLFVEVPPLSPTGMTQLLRRSFPSFAGECPVDLDASAIHPDIIDAAFRRSRSGEEALGFLRDHLANVRPPSFSVPAFDTLRGYGDAHAWGRQLVEDVAAFRAGAIAWSDVGAGALLLGPPGTGKTLFAQSLADRLAIPFFPTSYAAWQSVRSGHLGDVTRAIRSTFSEAAARAPSLVFIDEVDTIQGRGTDRANDWWTAITTTLLEALDGIQRRDGIIVMAACNSGDGLDPALVRAGRLDRTFLIELPDAPALAHIVSDALAGAVRAADLVPVMSGLVGAISGADAVRIARDVRRIGRMEKRKPTVEDVVSVALPVDGRPDRLVYRIAIHEAGHAVSYLASGIVPVSVSLLSRGLAAGGVATQGRPSETRLADLEERVLHLLAGRAAEEILLGCPSAGAGGSAGSDLAEATTIVAAIDARFGLGTRLTVGDRPDAQFVERTLQRLYQAAVAEAVRHETAIRSLAALLMERRVLGREAIEAFGLETGLLTEKG